MLYEPAAFVRKSPLSVAACGVFIIAAVWVTFNLRRWNHREILQWDTDGYYLYLPAAIIHHDPLHLGFLDSIPPGSFPKGYRFGQGAFPVPQTGRMCDKYTMGVAVFELPFFLVAHVWTSLRAPYQADGYSPAYHLAVAISSAFWPWLGLLVLAGFLRRYVNDLSTAITLLALGLGTNLFFYSSFAGGMSHPFLFFLCALLIDRTDRWYASPSPRIALTIGVCIGMATLTRPTCALVALIPLCWDARNGSLEFLRSHWKDVAMAAVVACCCIVPQLVYWKVTTGSLFFWSYGTETFDLTRPHIAEGLFGFRKGWFVYTPLALLGLVAPAAGKWPSALRSYGRMLVLFLVPFIYITFSWDPWWYGGGFGSRPMIETLPLLALPIALLITRMWSRIIAARTALGLAITCCIALNLFQQWQYQRGIIDCCAMTFERWWQVFLEPTTIGLPPFP